MNLGEPTEMKDKLVWGYDSKKNRWEIFYNADTARWSWTKEEKGEVMDQSDEKFKTMEDCEVDAKAHGMDGKFSR